MPKYGFSHSGTYIIIITVIHTYLSFSNILSVGSLFHNDYTIHFVIMLSVTLQACICTFLGTKLQKIFNLQ